MALSKTAFNNIPVCSKNYLTFRKVFFLIYEINHALNGDIRQMVEWDPKPFFPHGDSHSTMHRTNILCEKSKHHLRSSFTPDKPKTSHIKAGRKIHGIH